MQKGSSDPVAVPAGNLSEALYYAGATASGARLCDRKSANGYLADFERRFGKRIRRLMIAHEARYGKDPDFIVTSSCRGGFAPIDYTDAAHTEAHKRAMDTFDSWLTALERGAQQP